MGGSDCGKGCATNAKLRLRLEFMVELGVSICFSVIDMTYEIFRIGHAAYLHLIGLENSIVWQCCKTRLSRINNFGFHILSLVDSSYSRENICYPFKRANIYLVCYLNNLLLYFHIYNTFIYLFTWRASFTMEANDRIFPCWMSYAFLKMLWNRLFANSSDLEVCSDLIFSTGNFPLWFWWFICLWAALCCSFELNSVSPCDLGWPMFYTLMNKAER